ncbi:MAG: 3-deoxy-manno-octulosonate cytidylyltransferase [Rubrivivax sp.]|jgi:3-deoxy-manno-octulosonate cytidylyltransferase (CMP-KDO synthetase)|nr:3-deoxy-manno-octulosonate cytidylyltransferase [Rubrivivax sp.]
MPLPRPFTVLIPARLASTRLPDKPLADLAGKPMVVRVAERAAASGATRVVVAADDASIVAACAEHGVQAILTRTDHPSGSDRLAEASALLGLSGDDIVVNVQGDEPLIDPELIAQCAARLVEASGCVMSTAAHAITDATEFQNPNVVKVVLDGSGCAMLFSRAPIPWWRDASTAGAAALPGEQQAPALRHIGLYAYRAGFLQQYPELSAPPLERTESLEQLRVLWHGYRIAVFVTPHAPGPGVDTPEDLARVRALLATV